ncbi:AAA domain-containing protein [Flavobacterium sp. YJ01]|uniref:AAA domain-containing protein n=1 Tax=Flavobacterium sp. YJ01 TaxID=3031997 RepID=UPI0023E38925|nr:AAA domain-containing protein [Flavobacterium sp. YJ01]WET02738.1 AAA domain-containing protein [Flavobacterium sp. YJ01]
MNKGKILSSKLIIPKPKKEEIKNNINLFTRGSIVKATISKIIAPSQIIIEYVDGYIGRLSLIDISWSLPESEQEFKMYKVGDQIKCVVFDVNEVNKQVILTQKHLVNPINQTIKWERLERGEEFDVEIIQDLDSTYLVQTKNKLFGIVRKSLLNNQTKDLRLKINNKLDDSSLLDFVPCDQEQFDDFEIEEPLKDHLNFIEEDLQSFTKFKKTLLGQSANDKEIQIIKKGFDLDANIFSKEIDTGITLYIQFLLNSSAFETDFKQKAIPYYLNEVEYNIENEKAVLEILSNQKYWIKINKRIEEHKNNSKELITIFDFSIYNEEINLYGFIEIYKDNKNVKFGITNFSIGQNLGFASKIKKDSTKNGSFLFNNKLKVVSPLASLPFDNTQKQFLDYCLTKLECFEIIEKLKLDTGEILKQEGRTLAIIDKFLEYQISLLAIDNTNVFIEKFEKINSNSDGISIKLPREIGDKFELEEGIVNIKLYQKEKLAKFSEGFISIQEDNYILKFNRDINLETLQNGFYLDKKVSTWQFDIQREIIKDFLEKKIKIDHIESLLVNPSKVKSPILKNINFKNEDLRRTELEQSNNIQVRAVKKAIGNQNIFLVQGPPGTGKTTVIAEIIEQLTSNNEKILVSGQNHVAVDNVLEKIAKNPNLNLLRVGNPERIDSGLIKYCYHNLAEEYKIDYKLFIKNQKILTELFLDFVKKDINSKDRLLIFNKKVNDLIIGYNYLKDTFKEKHFILRDSLTGLSIKELFDTIQALSLWDESFNNECEVLLQPIIYNSVDVVFATCIGIKGDKIFKDSNFKFDTVIIDEAGKANIAETLVAIELGKKVILVGDQMQLPPYMDSSLIDRKDPNSFPNSIYGKDYTDDEIAHALTTSFFEFIINRIESKQFPSENKEMLNYQHRMHPNIGNFVSDAFYGAKVLMGSRTSLNKINMPFPFDKEIVFFDTSNSKDPFEQKEENSVKNDTEAEIITEFVLPQLLDNNIKTENIAIIAPYKFQVANIKEFIKKSTACKNINIDVATLDSFQGKEYDIIIFSFTRSTDHSAVKSIDGKKKYLKVGFLDDARRLNVAFSRAKKKLILVGNEVTLTSSLSHFDGMFNYTKLFRRLVQLSKNSEMGNFINIADYHHSGSSPFDNFIKNHKEKEVIDAEYRFIGKRNDTPYGVFFQIDNFLCLLPISFISIGLLEEIENFNVGQNLKLVIYKFDKVNQRVTLNLPKSDVNNEVKHKITKGGVKETIAEKKKRIWIENKDKAKVGMKYRGKIVHIADFGYIVEFENGLDGLLHITKVPKGVKLNLNQSVDVSIAKVDFGKQQISLKL